MIDHVGIKVSDYQRSKAFYLAALAPIGYQLVKEFPEMAAGFGVDGKPDLWIGVSERATSSHIALAAPDRAAVDGFFRAAIAAGGSDNGGPGLRSHYHPTYYAAFAIDPDGHNIEVVCHR